MSFLNHDISWPIRRTRPHEQNIAIDTSHYSVGSVLDPGWLDVPNRAPQWTWCTSGRSFKPLPWVPCPIDVGGVCPKTGHDLGPKMCRVVFPPQLSRGWECEAISICQLNFYSIVIMIKTIVIIVVIIVIVIILEIIRVIMLVIAIIIVIIVIINVSAVPGLKMIETQKQEQTLL